MRPAFEAAVETTLAEALDVSTHAEQSWATDCLVTTCLDVALRDVGISDLSAEEKRLLLCAALADHADAGLHGPHARDRVVDGIAFRAAFAEFRRNYTSGVQCEAVANSVQSALSHLTDVG